MFEATRSAGAYLMDSIHTLSESLVLLHVTIPAAFALPSSLQQQSSVQLPPAHVVIDLVGRSAGHAALQTMSMDGSITTHLRSSMADCNPHYIRPARFPMAGQESNPNPTAAGNVSRALQVLQRIQRTSAKHTKVHEDLGVGGQAACPVAYASLPQDAAEGFSIHPAVADSCMHVGALCGKPDGRIRVPGAVGAFVDEPLGSQGPQTSHASNLKTRAIGWCLTERWAVGEGEPEQADGTRRLSYSLSGRPSSPGVVIAGLEAKVLRSRTSGTAFCCSARRSMIPLMQLIRWLMLVWASENIQKWMSYDVCCFSKQSHPGCSWMWQM